MKGLSVLPDDATYVPSGEINRDADDGEPFAVIELDGLPGWATLNLGALDPERQRRYLLVLSRTAQRLATELAADEHAKRLAAELAKPAIVPDPHAPRRFK